MSQSVAIEEGAAENDRYFQAWGKVNQLLRLGHSFSGHERHCGFLNLNDGSFANISSISGFDLLDDGRGLAATDWDLDGDLDLWTTNRTAPRVRFLRNDTPVQNNFLVFRLEGTTSNRDAIGARVELNLADDQKLGDTLVQSLSAGEGYISQSSKWIHFGLGQAEKIEQLKVHWPHGQIESFPPPAINGHYRLVEGSGECVQSEVSASSNVLAPSKPSVPPSRRQAQSLLSARLPLPPLPYKTFDGSQGDLSKSTGSPRLVNLWASWCAPCRQEFTRWSDQEKSIRNAGIEIVALSVDALGDKPSTDVQGVKQTLVNLGFPFEAGIAEEATVEKLQIINNAVYDDHRPLPVPTSFLIDAEGKLAAIYKGPVSVERLLADVKRLELKGEALLNASLPSTGRWAARPIGSHRVQQIVDRLLEEGWFQDAQSLAKRLGESALGDREHAALLLDLGLRLQDKGDDNAAAEQFQKLLQLDPTSVAAKMQLGIIHAKQNELDLAIKFFNEAASLDDNPPAELYFNRGLALRRTGDIEHAVEDFMKVLGIDPKFVKAHAQLGLVHVSQGRFDIASKYFEKVVHLDSSSVENQLNYAEALKRSGNQSAALVQLKSLLQQQPKSTVALIHAGMLCADLEKYSEAIEYLRRAIATQPRAAKIRFALANLLYKHGDVAGALVEYREVERLVRGDPTAQVRIAWILATSPDDKIRNGTDAVRIARRAVNKTRRKDAEALDALAAAMAETGRFDDAIQAAQEALQLLSQGSNSSFASAVESRLVLYRKGQPYRETAN